MHGVKTAGFNPLGQARHSSVRCECETRATHFTQRAPLCVCSKILQKYPVIRLGDAQVRDTMVKLYDWVMHGYVIRSSGGLSLRRLPGMRETSTDRTRWQDTA